MVLHANTEPARRVRPTVACTVLSIGEVVRRFGQPAGGVLAVHAEWHLEVAHPTPAGTLVPDAVVLLADGPSAFVEIDRTMP